MAYNTLVVDSKHWPWQCYNESIVVKIGELTSSFLDLSQEINNAFTLHNDVKETLLIMMYALKWLLFFVIYALMQKLIMYFF